MLVAAFGVILVTVIVQGSTLAAVIRWTGLKRTSADAPSMDMAAAEQSIAEAQLAAVERRSRNDDGTIVHPRLLDQYARRVSVGATFVGTPMQRDDAVAAHFDVILAAVAAGREELLRLHRAHQIDDETLHSLEHDLDLDELGAISAKG